VDSSRTLIVPLAGVGHRFASKGFKIPKPFIEIQERTQLYWSIVSNVQNYVPSTVVIGFRTELESYLVREIEVIRLSTPSVDFVLIDVGEKTLGAAHTVSLILDKFPNHLRDSQIICVDSDVLAIVANGPLVEIPPNFIVTTNSKNPQHSFVRSVRGVVNEIAEKKMISNRGIAGTYAFQDSAVFEKAYLKQKQSLLAGREEYLSQIVSQTMHFGLVFDVEAKTVISLGTPEEINTIVVDLQSLLRTNRHE
jgi:NDP-sugar pyrophosphorylase family protein